MKPNWTNISGAGWRADHDIRGLHAARDVSFARSFIDRVAPERMIIRGRERKPNAHAIRRTLI